MRHIYPCPFNSEIDCTKKPGPDRCARCGFNPYEDAYRRGRIEGGSLKKDSNGIKHLRIKSGEDRT